MFYVGNDRLNDLYVLSNKAEGSGKNPKLINIGPTYIPEARVCYVAALETKSIFSLVSR